VAEIKHAFDGFIDRLDMTEERNSELKNISLEIAKAEEQREKIPEGIIQNI
jgi:hypothetical protein